MVCAANVLSACVHMVAYRHAPHAANQGGRAPSHAPFRQLSKACLLLGRKGCVLMHIGGPMDSIGV